jgi:hypothetical protein
VRSFFYSPDFDFPSRLEAPLAGINVPHPLFQPDFAGKVFGFVGTRDFGYSRHPDGLGENFNDERQGAGRLRIASGTGLAIRTTTTSIPWMPGMGVANPSAVFTAQAWHGLTDPELSQ